MPVPAQIEQDDLAEVDSQASQGVREPISRHLRRAALQELLDDVLVETGHAVQALVVVQMNNLLVRVRVPQRDVLAVGFRRPDQTCDLRHPSIAI